MPVIGEFHGKFWRSKSNAPPPPAVALKGGYPVWQASVIASMAIWGVPLEYIKPAWYWCWTLVRRIWWIVRLGGLTAEQDAALRRVLSSLQSPVWPEARVRVRDCATTLGFSDPKAWIHYSRALRENAGQAQNVYRHLKVVHELTKAHPTLTNPEAHLLAELAYQGMAIQGRPDRVVVMRRILPFVAH